MTNLPDPIPAEILTDAPFSQDELDAVIDTPADAPTADNAAARWEITSTGAAEFAMSRYAAAVADITAAEQQRDEWIARINAAFDADTKYAQRTAEWFRGHLERWGCEQRANNPRHATFHLPSGTVTTTNRGSAPTIVDKEAVAEWAERTGAAPVKVTKSVAFTDVKPVVKIAHKLVVTSDSDGNPVPLPGAAVVADDSPDGGGTLIVIDGETGERLSVNDVTVGDYVVDNDGNLVPGMEVRPGSIKASISLA